MVIVTNKTRPLLMMLPIMRIIALVKYYYRQRRRTSDNENYVPHKITRDKQSSKNNPSSSRQLQPKKHRSK